MVAMDISLKPPSRLGWFSIIHPRYLTLTITHVINNNHNLETNEHNLIL